MAKKKTAKKARAKPALTDKQRRFAEEYVVDLKATAAAIRAGYSKSSASTQASAMMAKPHVQLHIEKLIEERSKRTRITQDRVLQELACIAFSNIQDYDSGTVGKPLQLHEGAHPHAMRAVSRVKKRVLTKDDDQEFSLESVELQLWDKNKALQLAMRHLGMLNDKLQIDLNIELRKVIEQQANEYDSRIAGIATRIEAG